MSDDAHRDRLARASRVARASRRSPGAGDEPPPRPLIGSRLRLSLIMPVYNERTSVTAAVDRVRRELGSAVELVCVDDGSTDGTRAVLEELADRGAVDRLIAHERNRGKGAAIRSAIPAVTGDVVAVQDADLEYDPAELPRLLAPIADGRADAVFGSRFRGGEHRVLYFWHRVGNGMLTLFSNMLTDLNLTDMETCYKVVRRDLLQALPLRSNRFGFEPEITARLAQAGARIYEVPISYHGRTYAEGKKIGWKDGLAALWHILRCNLLPPRAAPYGRPDAAAAEPRADRREGEIPASPSTARPGAARGAERDPRASRSGGRAGAQGTTAPRRERGEERA